MSERGTSVGVVVFDEVEVLDFAGPVQVFSTAARLAPALGVVPFDTFTVGAAASVVARGGLTIVPTYAFDTAPPVDVLIVPGGVVTAELAKPAVIDWIAARAATARLTASVCTGAFLLAKAGLLAGKAATTHWEDIADLRAQFPEVQVEEAPRYVDEGGIVTSAGISAGIDMSLYLVERLAGEPLALMTARQMDYRWEREP
jgi:transcriptional regulator GlxA family with amidase domain